LSIRVAVLARPILFVASFEWRGRVIPFKPLKVTSTGKMSLVPKGFDRIGPSPGVFVVEYASMSFLLTPLNLNQSCQTSATTLILNRP
jgi:hypothetical protein